MAGSDVQTKAGLRCYRMLEAVILTVVIVTVCGVFAVPTLFFYISPATSLSNSTSNLSVCMELAVYTGDTCRVELQVYQECFSGGSSDSDILIRSDIDQETVEKEAELLIDGGIAFLAPSAECLAAIRPFLCLYSFGLCDSTGQLRQVSSNECVDLRDDICAREWNAAIVFFGAGALPVCEELSSFSDSCMSDTSSMSGFGEPPSVENVSILVLNSSETARECRDDYYLSDDNLCRPVCGKFSQTNSVVTERIIAAIIVTTCCIAIICGVIVIVLSFTVQRKFMLTFPSTYLLYLCFPTTAIFAMGLIGYFDKEALFCNNIDLLDSVTNPTPFCTATGFVYYYGLLQSTFWIVFHVAALFWGIQFPFHYRQFKENGYIKYIHIATVATAVLVPLVSGLAPLKDGYVPARFPPVVCIARNTGYTFYGIELPVSILLAITTSLLIVTFWIILKEFIIKKLSRGMKASKVGKAQVKIMFIFIYYLLLGILALGIFSYFVAINGTLIGDLQRLFLCESLGVNSGKNCNALRSSTLENHSKLNLVGVVMQGFITFVILVFVADCTKCRCKNKISTSKNSVKVEAKHILATTL